jgi:hypothetical protein
MCQCGCDQRKLQSTPTETGPSLFSEWGLEIWLSDAHRNIIVSDGRQTTSSKSGAGKLSSCTAHTCQNNISFVSGQLAISIWLVLTHPHFDVKGACSSSSKGGVILSTLVERCRAVCGPTGQFARSSRVAEPSRKQHNVGTTPLASSSFVQHSPAVDRAERPALFVAAPDAYY